MLIKQIHGRAFAFGLQWVDVDDDLEDAIESKHGEGNVKGTYFTVERGEAGTIGFVPDKASPRGRLYAAADALKAAGRDGLYLLQVDPESAWICGIHGGQVITGIDKVGTSAQCLNTALGLSSGLELPIFIDAGLASALSMQNMPGAEELDVWAILHKSRTKPMRKFGVVPWKLAFTILAILIAIGFATTSFNQKGEQVDPAVLRQQAQDTYVRNVARQIGQYPVSNQWAVNAMKLMHQKLPPYIAGWALDEVSCIPTTCTARYVHASKGAYAISPLQDLFGTNVAMTSRGKETLVTLKTTARLQSVDARWLHGLGTRTNTSFEDWIGALPISMHGANMTGPPARFDLAKKYQASSVGMPGLVLEQLAVRDSSYLGMERLQGMLSVANKEGFRAVRMQWLTGLGNPDVAWEIAWSRVHE